MSCSAEKKHPCTDCECCQWCSDDRCRVCLKNSGCQRRRLSIAEQIALFERINRNEERQS